VAGQRKLGTVRKSRLRYRENKKQHYHSGRRVPEEKFERARAYCIRNKIAALFCSLMVGKGTLQTWPENELILCNRQIKHQKDLGKEK
jgi:hypothetical protein